MTTSDIQTLVKRLLKQRSNRTAVAIVSPRRDWIIGLMIGFLLLLACTVFSVYTYVSYRYSEVLVTASEQTTIPAYKAAVVEDALTYIQHRADMFAAGVSAIATSPVLPAETPPAVATSSVAVVTNGSSTSITSDTVLPLGTTWDTPQLAE